MTLLLAQLRRERIILPIWIAAITLLAAASAGAVISQFGSEAERTAIVAIAVVSPAFLFMRGLPDGISVGALTFFQVFAFSAVAAGLMVMFLVTRHTRAEEESGRAELELSTAVRRADPLRSTLVLAVIATTVLSVAYGGALAAAGLPLAGSILFGAAVASVGLFFAGLAALVAQLAPSARSANAIVGAAVAGAFVLRGIGDALGSADAAALRVDASPLSLLSPIGWAAASRPFTDPQPWAVLVPVLAGAALALASLLLRERRDLGASIVGAAAGPARMRVGANAIGLAWRQSRTAVAAWAVAGAALGALGAGLSPLVASVVTESDTLAELVNSLLPGTDTDTASVFVSGLVGIAGLLAACAAVQAVLRLRADESAGRTELLLAAPVTRRRLVLAQILVAVVAALAVCLSVGVSAWLVSLLTGGADDPAVALSGLAHTPAALVFVGVSALAVTLLPRQATLVSWLALGLAVGVGQFGELLALPDWMRWLSPFSHSAAVPVETVHAGDVLLLLGAALACTAVALRRRELVSS